MQSYTWSSKAAILIAALLLPLFCSLAHAQELEGTWKLVMRKLPDGTTQVPPAVQGVATWHSGLRSLVVFWHTAEGKHFLASEICTYKLSDTEYTETALLLAVDDGSGKPPTYNQMGGTKTVPITRNGLRIAFNPPFDPPSFVVEGDKFTAMLEKATGPLTFPFVDYWERVR
jgi:hypothetical protein